MKLREISSNVIFILITFPFWIILFILSQFDDKNDGGRFHYINETEEEFKRKELEYDYIDLVFDMIKIRGGCHALQERAQFEITGPEEI